MPSRRSERSFPSVTNPAVLNDVPASPVNMNSYMESGGCFSSLSTVQVSRHGSFHETRVPDVKPGDLVKVAGPKKFGNQGQNIARVRCVVVYPCNLPSLIGLPGGCVLTKGHPVRIDGVWRKPEDVGIPTPNPSDHVWNFVLESNHILLVNGMECCTLGHGFQEEGVVHEYWGGRVLDDLSKISGWAQGYVRAFSEKDAEGHTIRLSANPKYMSVAVDSSVSETCAICMVAAADWACVPCGHKCGCADCLKGVRASTGKCPICRVVIQNVIKIVNSGHPEVQTVPAGGGAATDRHSVGSVTSRGATPPPAAAVVSVGSEPLPEPFLQVLPSASESDASVLVRVMVPECTSFRPPRDVCCVVDISGSMSAHSSIQDRNDPSIRQEDGLIVLDVVKHAIKTVILSLSPSDRLSIVAFDQAADLVMPLCFLDPVSVRRAIDGVEALRPRGQTNLWGGMLQGFESLRRGSALDDSPRSKTVTPPFALYNCFIVFCSSAANGIVSCTDFPAASCSD